MANSFGVEALLFDIFGTVVDWRGSIIRELTAWGEEKGIKADWTAFTMDWRGLYQPSMEEVRLGRRPFVILDTLHRESLEKLLLKYRIEGISEKEKDYINRVWHRLDPWPDVVQGLNRLKWHVTLATCSNGNVAILVDMARRARLPWDVILGGEPTGAYKPMPEAYLKSAAMLGLKPEQCMMVAAHNDDLAAASALELRTAMIPRPTEYGSGQTKDLAPARNWDVVADSFGGLAAALGC
ncbi:MAG: haloacid dehalogenase type II [Hyphomicrobiaceae bacterium]|nr:MAG: haloacid dehalogenase type II [Hyphomicrobiaceae bacterium]